MAINVYMLLDRSGSMWGQWSDALGAINAYVSNLEDRSTKITLATFDAPGAMMGAQPEAMAYEIIRNRVPVMDWKPLSPTEIQPRGGTPLYDAAGRMMDQMIADDLRKAVLVVMTDGEENSSREYTQFAVKAKVAKCVENNWPVVFLGANFDKVGASAWKVGVGSSNSIFATTRNLGATMTSMAAKTNFYASGAAATMEWSEQEKAAAASDVVVDNSTGGQGGA